MANENPRIEMGEQLRTWRGDRPTAEALASHPYIARVEDVSFSTECDLFEVSFHGGVPEMFTSIEKLTIRACWLGVKPGLWAKVIGEHRARKYGLGGDCITVLVEVEE